MKFRTKNYVEVDYEPRGRYNLGDEIKFKTTILRSSLCDYSNGYILVKVIITITGAGGDPAAQRIDERDKLVSSINCAPFTNCISKINNTQADTDVVMPMFDLIEYSDNCTKTSGSLWQYHNDDPSYNIKRL